ncbi:MAG TPA: hypothetical protein VFV52_00825 [Bacilli bacterium]|nr:hypothetical protein [Bacilli bacterium]
MWFFFVLGGLIIVALFFSKNILFDDRKQHDEIGETMVEQNRDSNNNIF